MFVLKTLSISIDSATINMQENNSRELLEIRYWLKVAQYQPTIKHRNQDFWVRSISENSKMARRYLPTASD